MSSQLPRLVRTLWYLRPSQMAYRARYMLEHRLPARPGRWRWTGPFSPRLRDDLPPVALLFSGCPTGERLPALLAGNQLSLLGQERSFAPGAPDWRLGPVTADRLWTINLHYHAWAVALAAVPAEPPDAAVAHALLERLVQSWLTECALERPGARSLAWNAYAIATRIGCWARVLQLRGSALAASPIGRAMRESLWLQAAYLDDHLERDLLANHLLRDAVGLCWAGRLFAEPAARDWLARGTALAVEQARAQVLPDGGHFERSPMYHLHALEDFLTVLQLVEDPAAHQALSGTARRMIDYVGWLAHPDGTLPLFNDAAENGAAPLGGMLEEAARLGVCTPARRSGNARHFADTGLIAIHRAPLSILFDVGDVGPDEQPGHAHADTLTLELSVAGHRLFVDPGTFAYDDDDRRRYDRSTAAHNTVTVDGLDSSEVWQIFRVGRRARAGRAWLSESGSRLAAGGSHDGYAHLAGSPRVGRTIELRRGVLRVEDTVEGSGRHTLGGGWLLHPSWHATLTTWGWSLEGPAQHRVEIRCQGPAGLERRIEWQPWHPGFGVEIETRRLCWCLAGALPARVHTTITLD